MQIGFIGFGRMGSQMCGHLLKAGHTVVAYDVRPEAMQELGWTVFVERTAEEACTPLYRMQEKMVALGGLVAGVPHEINAPLGIGVAAASLLGEQTTSFRKLYQAGRMKRSDLEAYLVTTGDPVTDGLVTSLTSRV